MTLELKKHMQAISNQKQKDKAMAVPKNAKLGYLRNKLNPIKPNPRVLTETGFKAKIKKKV